MRIIYMGTPDFAVPPLEALIKAGHDVSAVFTQPDKPKGRGMKLKASPVKEAAVRLGIPVYQPETFRGHAMLPVFKQLKPDLIAVAAYGKILPLYTLRFPKYGCINVHASYLPKYRGAAPIQRSIIDGCRETGVTIIRMEKGIDTGDMLLRRSTPISDEDDAGVLTARLAEMGARMLVEVLPQIEAGTEKSMPQDDGLSNYAAMITREDGRIDWKEDSRSISCRVRGVTPSPGAYTTDGEKNYKLSGPSHDDLNTGKPAGTVLGSDTGAIAVACGEGTVYFHSIQAPGKRMMPAVDYVRGHKLPEKFL